MVLNGRNNTFGCNCNPHWCHKFKTDTKSLFQYKECLFVYMDFQYDKWLWDCLIFIIGILILVRWNLHTETPSGIFNYTPHCFLQEENFMHHTYMTSLNHNWLISYIHSTIVDLPQPAKISGAWFNMRIPFHKQEYCCSAASKTPTIPIIPMVNTWLYFTCTYLHTMCATISINSLWLSDAYICVNKLTIINWFR